MKPEVCMALMIGMAKSEDMKLILTTAVLNMACAACLCADVVTMTSGIERLTGDLRSIEDGGVLELQSGLSPDPLRVRASMVGKVEFATEAVAPEPAPARVELVNGDVIPCRIVGLDKGGLVVESTELGRIHIERRHLEAMQLGVRPDKVLYAASQGMGGWSVDQEDSAAWRFENGAMLAMGQSVATRSVGFPEQFILKFELEWARNAMPAIMVFFADPLVANDERCDRYCLSFQSTGLEVKREAAKNRRFTTVAFVNRMPAQCEGRRLRVELQIDRRDSSLRLLLDGKLEGEFVDPVPSPPSGAGLVLVSQADGVEQKVSGLEVLECDNTPRMHRAESRGDEDGDSLITRRNERWSGVLEEIASSNTGAVLRFRFGFEEKCVEVPLTDVSTVFFSRSPTSKAFTKEPSASYVLSYAGAGLMHISSCRFSNDSAIIQHPLLGSLQMRRNFLRAIERVVTPAAKPASE